MVLLWSWITNTYKTRLIIENITIKKTDKSIYNKTSNVMFIIIMINRIDNNWRQIIKYYI